VNSHTLLDSFSPSDAEAALQFVNVQLAQRIDRALCEVGDFGAVKLIIVRGRVRFIEIIQSQNVDGDSYDRSQER
jgi:hypothetical protein